jgi:hypothetical protein
VAVVHFGALLLLIPLSLSLPVSGIAVVLILAHGLWTVKWMTALPRKLTLRSDGTAVVETARHRTQLRVVAARRLPGAVQLVLKPAHGRSRALLLMQDALSAADFHELCARIRQQRLPVRESITPR